MKKVFYVKRRKMFGQNGGIDYYYGPFKDEESALEFVEEKLDPDFVYFVEMAFVSCRESEKKEISIWISL